uniref:ABC transporter family G domain-containing protein n=1 Tax=Tetraselmis chuii TaxID=63592 RepID=A0A7S1T152_9CHLO
MSLGDCYWKFPNSLYTSSLPFRSKDVGRANDVLSASESRRLSVATQLVSARPKVLLLSEVTEGLPPAEADYLLTSLRSHVETYLHTVVISMPEYPSASSAGNGSSTLTPKNLDALVLGAGGRSVYFGPIEDLTSHFSSIGYSPCSEEDNLCICCRALDPFAAALKLISVDEAAAIKSAEALELSKESIPRTPPNALVPSGRKLKKCNSKMRELPIPRSCQTSHTGMEHPVYLISLLAAGLPLSSHEADSEGVSHRVLGSETESIFGSPIGCTSDQSGKTSQTQAAISEYTISPTATAIMSSPEQSSQKYAERSSSACGVRARNINSSDPLQLRKAAHKGSTRSQVSSPSGRMKSKSMSPSVADTPGSGGYPFSEFLSSSAFSSESASSDMPEKENSSPNSPGSSSLRHFQQAEDFGGFCFPAGTQTPSTDRSRSTASVANCSSGFFNGNTSQGSSSSSHSPASSARPGGRNAATAASETFTSKAAYDHIDDNAKSAALFDGVIPKGTVGNGCFPELASNMMNGGKAKNPTAHSIDRRPFARAEITWVLTQRAMRAATRDFSGLPMLFLTLLYYLLVYGNTPKDDSPAWLWMTTMSVLLPGYGLVCGIQGIKMWCENHRIASIENQKGYYSMYAWVIAQVVCQLFCRMGCSFLSAIAFQSICQLAAAHSTNWGAETLQMAFLDALTVSMYGLFMWSCGCVCATTTQTAYQAGILLVAVSYLVLFPAFFAIISLGDDS